MLNSSKGVVSSLAVARRTFVSSSSKLSTDDDTECIVIMISSTLLESRCRRASSRLNCSKRRIRANAALLKDSVSPMESACSVSVGAAGSGCMSVVAWAPS